MVKFTDQQIRDKGFLYIPKQQYLQKPFQIPTTEDTTEDEVVTDEGIVNTNAFANSGGGGDFNPAGNMFGEGTAVSPVYGNTYIDTVRREGPESRQAVEALINASGSAPGGLMPQEYGFQYTSDFGNNLDYSKSAFDSLESEEKQNFFSKLFNKAGKIKAGLPTALKNLASFLNPLSFATNIFGGAGSSGPSYGIAGLTDQQKGLYDALASKGMLFDDQGIFKTLTGKNFMGKGYLEGQQDIYNDLKDQGYDVDEDGNITLNGQLVDFTNKNYLKKKIEEAFTSGKGKTITNPILTPELINEFVIENNDTTETPVGADTITGPNINEEEGRPDNPNTEPPGYTGGGGSGVPDQIGGGDGNGGQQNDGPGDTTDASGTEGEDQDRFARGGRVKYFYGGKV